MTCDRTRGLGGHHGELKHTKSYFDRTGFDCCSDNLSTSIKSVACDVSRRAITIESKQTPVAYLPTVAPRSGARSGNGSPGFHQNSWSKSRRAACMMRRNDCSAAISYSMEWDHRPLFYRNVFAGWNPIPSAINPGVMLTPLSATPTFSSPTFWSSSS